LCAKQQCNAIEEFEMISVIGGHKRKGPALLNEDIMEPTFEQFDAPELETPMEDSHSLEDQTGPLPYDINSLKRTIENVIS
jgi:hypothetical protein